MTPRNTPRPKSAARNRIADAGLTAAYDEIGLSRTTAWYASIFLNGLGAVTIFGAAILLPNLVPPHFFLVGFAFLLVALSSLVCLKFWTEADWGVPIRITGSWSAFSLLAFMVGDARIAFIWIPMIAITSACSLYGTRRGVQYTVIAVGLILAVGATSGSAYAAAISVVGAVGIVTIAIALLIVQTYVRDLAVRNQRMATTDELTKVANMRSLREHIAERLARRETDGEFALFAIDLNQFKRVNDEFDHGMGDRVLQMVATEMSFAVGTYDLVARRGGDEFSVLAPNLESRSLESLRTELTHAIHRARMAVCPEIDPTGSVGYTISREGDELATLLRRADDALHEAKREYRESTPAPSSVTRIHAERVMPTHADEVEAGEPVSTAHYDAERRSRQIVWGLATMLFGTCALLVGILGLLHAIDPMPGPAIATLVAAFAALAGVCAFGWQRDLAQPLLYLVYAAAIAIAVAAVPLADTAGVVIVNLLPLIAMYGFILFRARPAGLFLLTTIVGMSILAATMNFPNATIAGTCTAFVMLSAGGWLAKVRSVTANFVRANLELSEIDSLTGIANFRALRARVAGTVANHKPSVVIALDLDEFKAVNEVYSHSVGDAVLVATARAISESARINDLVARRGGDEFYVIADDADEAQAKLIAARMSDAIEAARRRICPNLRPTASIAIATTAPGDDVEMVMQRADLALHAKKQAAHSRRDVGVTQLKSV